VPLSAGEGLLEVGEGGMRLRCRETTTSRIGAERPPGPPEKDPLHKPSSRLGGVKSQRRGGSGSSDRIARERFTPTRGPCSPRRSGSQAARMVIARTTPGANDPERDLRRIQFFLKFRKKFSK